MGEVFKVNLRKPNVCVSGLVYSVYSASCTVIVVTLFSATESSVCTYN